MTVRVSKYKTIFEKGYTPNWTTEVFKIVKIQHINPVTYLLKDYRGKSIVGAFYEYELHRASYPDIFLVEKVLHRRGNEVYVKWLGFATRGIAQFMDTQGQCNLIYTKIFNVKRIKNTYIHCIQCIT